MCLACSYLPKFSGRLSQILWLAAGCWLSSLRWRREKAGGCRNCCAENCSAELLLPSWASGSTNARSPLSYDGCVSSLLTSLHSPWAMGPAMCMEKLLSHRHFLILVAWTASTHQLMCPWWSDELLDNVIG